MEEEKQEMGENKYKIFGTTSHPVTWQELVLLKLKAQIGKLKKTTPLPPPQKKLTSPNQRDLIIKQHDLLIRENSWNSWNQWAW